jgi:hypothetical protein
MPNISSYDPNSISTLFSGLSAGKTGSTSSDLLGISYTDYASIRSGGYYQLMKEYYAKSENSTPSSTSTAKDTTATLARIEDNADGLKDSADKLLEKGSDSLFNKVETKNKDGSTTNTYDTDKIYNALKDFVGKYNDVLDTSGQSNVKNIQNAESTMTDMTNKNAALLKSAGITIGADDKLSIDKDAFKKVDMSTVKSLFNSTGSYGYQVSAQASMINFYAENESTKANTYNNAGTYTYNYATGEMYNSAT